MRQRQRGEQHLAKNAVLEVQRRGATPRLWLQELRRKFGASVSSTQRKVSETLEARLHRRHPGRGGGGRGRGRRSFQTMPCCH